jgi:hypothetical protein
VESWRDVSASWPTLGGCRRPYPLSLHCIDSRGKSTFTSCSGRLHKGARLCKGRYPDIGNQRLESAVKIRGWCCFRSRQSVESARVGRSAKADWAEEALLSSTPSHRQQSAQLPHQQTRASHLLPHPARRAHLPPPDRRTRLSAPCRSSLKRRRSRRRRARLPTQWARERTASSTRSGRR